MEVMCMKLKETFIGHTNEGRFAFFIKLGKCNLNCSYCREDNKTFVDIDYLSIAEQAMHFPRVVITGGEPMVQKEDVGKLIKKLRLLREDIVIEVETNGTIRPVGISDSKNLIFNVCPKMKNSKNPNTERIVDASIKWFVEYGANFHFIINDKSDVDEVVLFVHEFEIKKDRVFLIPIDEKESINMIAKFNGFNIVKRDVYDNKEED